MSAGEKKTGAVVSRDYKPSTDACTRALHILLRTNEGGAATAPDDAEESENDRTDTCIIPGPSRCLIAIFDLQCPCAEQRLQRELAAWRGFARAERILDGRVMLVIQPGAASGGKR